MEFLLLSFDNRALKSWRLKKHAEGCFVSFKTKAGFRHPKTTIVTEGKDCMIHIHSTVMFSAYIALVRQISP